LKYLVQIFVGTLLLSGCLTSDLYEKNIAIPGHAWDYSFKPTVSFDIIDTTSSYNIFLVVRHTDAFRYNNLWVKIRSKTPGDSVAMTQQFDLPLATQHKWTATGMDDIFEHRILLYRRPVKFSRSGSYTVVMEHVMRENPLEYIMNVGLRLEKVQSP
jgi:gliding motility-associated lipoprotein GldH